MPIVEINDLAKIGQINDIAAFMLPPEAWTFSIQTPWRVAAATAPATVLGMS